MKILGQRADFPWSLQQKHNSVTFLTSVQEQGSWKFGHQNFEKVRFLSTAASVVILPQLLEPDTS